MLGVVSAIEASSTIERERNIDIILKDTKLLTNIRFLSEITLTATIPVKTHLWCAGKIILIGVTKISVVIVWVRIQITTDEHHVYFGRGRFRWQ